MEGTNFNRQRTILTNKNVKWKLRLMVFNVVATPAISFQFAHFRSDGGQIKKYEHIATQNATIVCLLGTNDWRGLVRDDARNAS